MVGRLNERSFEVIRLYADGQSMKAIARRYGVAPQTVKRVLITFGIEIRGSEKYQELKHLLDIGLSDDQIAAALNIKPASVAACKPYSKGAYRFADASQNALTIRKSREKKKENLK